MLRSLFRGRLNRVFVDLAITHGLLAGTLSPRLHDLVDEEGNEEEADDDDGDGDAERQGRAPAPSPRGA